jgi:antitoxin component YwqK of YwqJK toxin-antitoxin module
MLRVQWNEVSFSPRAGPNGNYLYQGQLFTGVRYKVAPSGEIECEEEYRQGLRWGLSREWYRSGTLYHEATYYRDVLHGMEKEWDNDGRLHEERECRYGILLKETIWDKDGNVVKHYELTESDGNYKRLQTRKKLFDRLDENSAS